MIENHWCMFLSLSKYGNIFNKTKNFWIALFGQKAERRNIFVIACPNFNLQNAVMILLFIKMGILGQYNSYQLCGVVGPCVNNKVPQLHKTKSEDNHRVSKDIILKNMYLTMFLAISDPCYFQYFFLIMFHSFITELILFVIFLGQGSSQPDLNAARKKCKSLKTPRKFKLKGCVYVCYRPEIQYVRLISCDPQKTASDRHCDF